MRPLDGPVHRIAFYDEMTAALSEKREFEGGRFRPKSIWWNHCLPQMIGRFRRTHGRPTSTLAIVLRAT